MSNPNDYYDLDNFDEDRAADIRDYRRRHQPQRKKSVGSRPSSSNTVKRNKSGKPSVSKSNRSRSRERQRRKMQRRRQLRNRITIIMVGVIVIVLLVLLINTMFRGCSNSKKNAGDISTETKSTAEISTTNNSQNANTADALSPTYFSTPVINDDNTSGISSYGIYVWHNTGYELFNGDDTKARTYADAINSFAGQLGSGIKIYDMVVPNNTEMSLPQRLKNSDALSVSQAENIKSIYSYLSDNVTPINCYNYLAKHNTEYIYFNSDHHWTGLGAYYAYSAFADTTNQNVLSLDDCTENQVDGFTGSFSDFSSDINSDSVHYWELPYSTTMEYSYSDGTTASYDSPYYQYAEAGSNTYGVFIMGDNQDAGLTVLKSTSETAGEGKKIAVVKDGYGNAFVPYLTYNYGEVHVVDFRYFNRNFVTYCNENDIDEVLFLNGIMSANTQVQIDSMLSLFQ